jgi:hypothetical protein
MAILPRGVSLVQPDQSGTLRRFTAQALVLMGWHDQLCPLDRHQAMRQAVQRARRG